MLEVKQNTVYKYFLSEMEYLRSRAVEFSRDYPRIAHELRLSEGKSSDPHVELLLQSFAFLTGSLRSDMEAESNQVPIQLLGTLYPHLVTPIPSMTVLQLDVLPGGANFENGWLLARNREFFNYGHGDRGRHLRCRFRSAYNTELRPLEIGHIAPVAPNTFDFTTYPDDERHVLQAAFGRAHAILKVVIRNKRNNETEAGSPIHEYGLDRLGFYIDGHELNCWDLYTLLASNLLHIAVRSDLDDKVRLLNRDGKAGLDAVMQWRGFSDNDAVLPYRDSSHKAYRLLQEYFLFPEKYLFFDMIGIDHSQIAQGFDLLFLFDTANLLKLRLGATSLRLNCVPVINLFLSSLEPLRLHHQDHEYRLVADLKHHAFHEVHSVDKVVVTPENGEPRTLSPYIGLSTALLTDSSYSYSTRIEKSPLKSVPGTETYIAFHDRKFDLELMPNEVVSIQACCTNRRLPEQLRIGDLLQMEGGGPVTTGMIALKPSRHLAPKLDAQQPWFLVSNLNLNHLSLSGNQDGLAALQNVLRIYANELTPSHAMQIRSISALRTRGMYKRMGRDAWRGFCQGTAVTLELDENVFEGNSPLLFAEVLRRFFALYASVNHFVEFALESKQRKGIWKQWDPLAGEQIVL